MILRYRLYAAWLIVGGAVDPPSHRVGFHRLGRIWHDVGGYMLIIVEVRIE